MKIYLTRLNYEEAVDVVNYSKILGCSDAYFSWGYVCVVGDQSILDEVLIYVADKYPHYGFSLVHPTR